MTEVEKIPEAMAGVRQLRTDDLKPNNWNPNRMTREEFAELVEEVRHLGRLPKPVVVRNGYAPGEWLIVDGEHGWRAAKEVGLAEIACEVIEADDFEAMRQTYKRNQHGTHDRVALGQMFRRMKGERGISNRELAKEINVSEGTIRNALLFAEAAELRNRYAPEKGATSGDYWFNNMTTKQARLYVELPDSIRDRWLDSGMPDEWGLPEDVVFDSWNEIVWYANELHGCGIDKLFERGSWATNAKQAYELHEWRNRHLRFARGVDAHIDDYIRPVVELHPKTPSALEIMQKLPIREGKPFLTPGEWAEAVRVAWEKGGTVGGVLGRFKDIAKLKAAEEGIPAEDLDDPRQALMKLEVEQDAPDFIRDADLPLKDRHYLTKEADRYFDIKAGIDASVLSDEERLEVKRAVVDYLVGAWKRFHEQKEAREGFLKSIEDLPPEMQMKAIMGGLGPRQPEYPLSVKRAWHAGIKNHREAQEQAEKNKRMAEVSAVFEDPEKVVEAVVERFNESIPKVMEERVGDRRVADVLPERLRAIPQAELLLLGAVVLKAPVTPWLEAVRKEHD